MVKERTDDKFVQRHFTNFTFFVDQTWLKSGKITIKTK